MSGVSQRNAFTTGIDGKPHSLARTLAQIVLITATLSWSADPLAAQRQTVPQRRSTSGRTPAQWSAFRGPSGQGISTETDLPLNWSRDSHIAWQKELPGPGASSPIVFHDSIYLTCYSGYFVPGQPVGNPENLKRHLMCLDRTHGTIRWNVTVPALLPEEKSIRDHGFAANTPSADESGVYCFFGKTGVLKFDHNGNELWKTSVGTKTHGWGTAASPLLYQDLVIINASVESESLVALNRNTGKIVWQADNIREAWNTPVIVRNTSDQDELVVATHGTIRSYEPLTGKLLWTCATDIQWYMVPGIVTDNGVVYSLGGRSGTAGLAVRAGGQGDVTETHRLWTSQKGSNVSSPVLHDGHLYWMNENSGMAFCAELASGEIVYQERVNRIGQIYSSPLLADGRIYYLSRDGRTIVVPAEPRFEILADNDLRDGSLFNGSFAVDDHRLLVRSDRSLYCIAP
ncbi:MAG: PQQ-binding-like beta-propeller repeat protein [Planctomycetaceae bacterium]|nr:PQQ-binding-like beta-propeller repeat protein [Planctomycetaceae bacterium]